MSSPSDLAGAGTHHHWLVKWTLALVAAIIIFLALAVGVFRIAVNLLPRYHNRIEQVVSETIGEKVSLGRIALRWANWGPELVASNVVITGSLPREFSLDVEQVGLSFSLGSLFHGTSARPKSIQVDRPMLIVHRSVEQLPGLAEVLLSRRSSLPQRRGKGNTLSALKSTNIRLKDGTVRFSPLNKEKPSWTFKSINFFIHNGPRHEFLLRFMLPRELGKVPLRLSGRIAMTGGNPANWKWQGHLAISGLELAGVNSFMPDKYAFKGGSLGIQSNLWGLGARLTALAGQLAVEQTRVSGLTVSRLSTNFMGRFGKTDSIDLSHFKLEGKRLSWAPGSVRLGLGPDGRFHMFVAHVELSAVTALSELLPSRYSSISQRLKRMDLNGSVNQFSVGMQPGARQSLELTAFLDDVSFYNAMGAPGLRDLNASVRIHGGQGAVKLSGPLTLWMPHLFGHPVPLEQVDGTLRVHLLPVGFSVATRSLRIKAAGGLQGSIEGGIRYQSKEQIDLALRANAGPLDLDEARRLYLPTGLIPKPLVRWLLHDLASGRITGMTMSLDGNARHFPFRTNRGNFSTQFGFRSVKLKPGDKWQPISHLSGTVAFRNAQLDAKITNGKVSGARIISGTAQMRNLFKPLLQVSASIRGQAKNFLTFLRTGPIGKNSTALLGKLRARGPVSTKLRLELPIHAIKKFSLMGDLRVSGLALSYVGFPARLEELTGQVRYDRKGPLGGQLSGQTLGSPIEVRFGRKSANHVLAVGFRTHITLSRLPNTYRSEFSQYASGSLPVSGQVSVPLAGEKGPLTVELRSTLDGLAVNLPRPLGKPSNLAVRTVATLKRLGDSYEIRASYGSRLGICLGLRALAGFKFSSTAVGVTLGKGRCLVPQRGLQLSGTWPVIDLGQWARYVGHHQPGQGVRLPRPLSIAVDFGRLNAFGASLQNVHISGTSATGLAKLRLRGPQLKGNIDIPTQPAKKAPILADIDYLDLAGTTLPSSSPSRPHTSGGESRSPTSTSIGAQVKESERAKPGGSLQPDSIPAFNLTIHKLRLHQGFFQDVHIEAQRVPNGILIRPISIEGGMGRLSAAAIWFKTPGKVAQGALHFVANVNHLGDLLGAMGLGPVMTGHGSVSASLAWHGSVDNKQFWKTLVGRFSTDIRDGSISQVHVGAGRLLSLLNLANVPRYLTLDFHNLFSKGFPFSRIHGNYNIRNGVAKTRGMVIDSSVAHIKLAGSINLVDQTMDQEAAINPNYTGSLPVVAAILGGLGVGAAIFAVTKIFGSPIAQATELHYTIRGPISKPVVKKGTLSAAGHSQGSR